MNLSETFLGIIAAATLLMALIQVGAIVAILRVARQAQQTIALVHRDVRPLIEKATVVAEQAAVAAAKASAVMDEASRTATIATVQAEKIDKLLSDLAVRVDHTAGIVQQAIITPAREGLAVVAALKAGLGALRGFRDRPRHGRAADEEDPLFIG